MKQIHIKYKYVFFGLISGFIVIILSIIIVNNNISRKYKGRILPNIYLNNESVSNLSIKEINNNLQSDINNLQKLQITISYEDKFISTLSGKMLNFKIDNKKINDTLMNIGRENKPITQFITRFKLFILKEPYNLTFLPSFTSQPLITILENIKTTFQEDPKDALFKFEGNRVTAFSNEKIGKKILSNEALSQTHNYIEKSIANKKYKPIFINVQSQQIEPLIKLSDTNSLGIKELIGSGSSDFSGSIENRIYNIELSSSKFNGLIIKPKEELSFNKTVGNISYLSGYKQAYVIENGRTVLGDGGGVCQVSTTLFRAALNTGLNVTQRVPHAYRVHYYEENSSPGLDATVFAPTVDFKFINDTNNAILIQTMINRDTNQLNILFYGTKDGRKINISPVIIWGISSPPEPIYQDDPSLPNGVIRQVDWSAWGAKTKFTYEVTKDNEVLHYKEFVSNYRPWQAVYLRGAQN